MKLSQIRYFAAVYEEGSFTAAARRENATQSGLSMQIKDLEAAVGAQLFVRLPSGVEPTPIGTRLYGHCTELLRKLSDMRKDIAAASEALSGDIHIGLMPTFTRAVLAPALTTFTDAYPHVNVRITEAYSAVLSEAVAGQLLDFAVVPPGQVPVGVSSSHMARDREYLVTGPATDRRHLEPVVIARETKPLRLVLPGPQNARRVRINEYLKGCGAQIEAVMEMDAMMGTLDLVAHSNWVTILPGALCAPDLDGRTRKLHPLSEPALDVSYAMIEPATRSLSTPARLFAEELKRSVERLITSCGL